VPLWEDLRFPFARAIFVKTANPARLLPSRQLIKRELDAGKLGEPGLIRIHHWDAKDEMNENDSLPAAVLQELDVILWLMAKSPTVVHALEQGNTAENKQGRYLHIHLGFPGGGMALLDFSSLHPPGDPYRMLHVIGSAGAAYADDHQNMQLLFQGGPAQCVFATEQAGKLREHELSGMTQDWKAVLAVAEAVKRSLTTQQAVSLEGP
jgi:predicted dehydrogenase